MAETERGPARVAGALPGETVSFRVRRRHRGVDEGVAVAVREPAPDRVEAPCLHAGDCGGCSLQHLDPGAQVRWKEERLREHLRRHGVPVPKRLAAPVVGPALGYRRRARLGVKHVPKKGGALVGFREHASPYLAVLSRCEILAPPAGGLVRPLRDLVSGLDARAAVPQVEVAVGENGAALVFRHLVPLSAADREALGRFGRERRVGIHLQPGGPDTVAPFHPTDPEPLYYTLPAHDLRLAFAPTDFVQVNCEVNRRLVDRVLDWIAPAPGERVLDLFAGIGNLTLPVARRGAHATGLEGDPALVARARENGRANRLDVPFHAADLATATGLGNWLDRGFAKLLLDPPRSGAAAVVERLPARRFARVVYVSCNPETLARDAAVLCRRGYTLGRVGLVDMFPHTAHGEAVALFTG